MRIGALLDVEKPLGAVVEQAGRFAEAGYSAAWATQIFGFDALTLLAIVAGEVPEIELGTGVVPVYSRIPQTMAQQALSVQAVSGGRLTLGIGMSHEMVVTGLWGQSWEKPARYLREYLTALVPMLHGEASELRGELLTAVTLGALEIADAPPPRLVIAALGPTMLKLAGRVATGTVTWMTGIETIRNHVTPTITAAAADAGKPAPMIGVSLPVCVTSDRASALERIDRSLAIYPTLPSYKAMLDREGVTKPSEIAFVGTEEEIKTSLARLADAGATDFVAAVVGDATERAATEALLSEESKCA